MLVAVNDAVIIHKSTIIVWSPLSILFIRRLVDINVVYVHPYVAIIWTKGSIDVLSTYLHLNLIWTFLLKESTTAQDVNKNSELESSKWYWSSKPKIFLNLSSIAPNDETSSPFYNINNKRKKLVRNNKTFSKDTSTRTPEMSNITFITLKLLV